MTLHATAESLAAILQALPPNPRVIVSGNFASPRTALALFDEHIPQWRLWTLNPQPGLPEREGITPETSFVGAGMRKNPRLRYVPCRLSLVPALFSRAMQPDVVLLHTSTPRHGVVSLGIEVNVMPAAIEACRARGGKVIAQANPSMPFTYGDAIVPLSSIDVLFEADEPLTVATQGTLDDTSQGHRRQDRRPDQGRLHPADGHRRSARRRPQRPAEPQGPAVLDRDVLRRCPGPGQGRCAEPRCRVWPSRSCSAPRSSTSGSTATPACAWCAPRPATIPGLIAQQPLMTSVNSALQVDLFAQANASRINARIYSGFGGQTDFIVGALHAPGGQAFIALRSWHPKANVSTIVPLLDEPVTSFQHTAVVTEQGIAEIWGRSQDEQARNLITQAAHPDVREELFEEAANLGLHAG